MREAPAFCRLFTFDQGGIRLKKGEVLHGFRLVRRQDVTNIGKTKKKFHMFVHEESGLTVFWLAGKEERKTCVIGMRTRIADDSGIAHVVEHAVLSGSERYPVKNMTSELTRMDNGGSANAWTSWGMNGYHFTCRSETRFFHLLDVFFDCVYHPLFLTDPHIFAREGWHYEWEDGKLRRSGAAYSEKKDETPLRSLVWQRAVAQELYPGAPEGFEFGGVPEQMATLTQERAVAFHHAFYHPANTCVCLIGELDIARVLQFIEEEVLPHVERHAPVPYEPHHPRVQPLRHVVRRYPQDPQAKEPGKTVTTLTWMIDPYVSWLDMDAKNVLSHGLFEHRDSLIHQALKAERFKVRISDAWEDFGRQQTFSLVLEGKTQKDAERFQHAVQKALQGVDRAWLEDYLLDMADEVTEDELREDARWPHESNLMTAGMNMILAWTRGKHPLRYERTGQRRDLLQHLRDGSVFRFLWNDIIHTPPSLLLTLVPSATWHEERQAEETKALAAIASRMTTEERTRIAEAAEEQRAWQAKEDPPAVIARLMEHALDDVPKTYQPFPVEEIDFCGGKLFVGASEEPDVMHLTIEFDVTALPAEDRTVASLLTRLLNAFASDVQEDDLYRMMRSFRAHVYTASGKLREARKVVSIEFDEWMTEGERALAWLARLFREEDVLHLFPKDSVRDAVTCLWKRMQKRGFRKDARRFFLLDRISDSLVPYLAAGKVDVDAMECALDDWNASFAPAWETIAARLSHVWTAMRQTCNITMLLRVPGARRDGLCEALRFFMSVMPQGTPAPVAPPSMPRAQRVGFCASSPLLHIAKGCRFQEAGFSYRGSMDVLASIVTFRYLLPRIRGEGGAYGAQCYFFSWDEMNLCSINDPHLTRTLGIFDGAGDFVRALDLTPQELEQSVLGVLGEDSTWKQAANEVLGDFRRGITPEMHQQFLDEVRGTTLDDLRALAPIFDACADHGALCVYGNRDVLEAHRELFDTLENAPF